MTGIRQRSSLHDCNNPAGCGWHAPLGTAATLKQAILPPSLFPRFLDDTNEEFSGDKEEAAPGGPTVGCERGDEVRPLSCPCYPPQRVACLQGAVFMLR